MTRIRTGNQVALIARDRTKVDAAGTNNNRTIVVVEEDEEITEAMVINAEVGEAEEMAVVDEEEDGVEDMGIDHWTMLVRGRITTLHLVMIRQSVMKTSRRYRSNTKLLNSWYSNNFNSISNFSNRSKAKGVVEANREMGSYSISKLERRYMSRIALVRARWSYGTVC